MPDIAEAETPSQTAARRLTEIQSAPVLLLGILVL
jgi:hypothetical protein